MDINYLRDEYIRKYISNERIDEYIKKYAHENNINVEMLKAIKRIHNLNENQKNIIDSALIMAKLINRDDKI